MKKLALSTGGALTTLVGALLTLAGAVIVGFGIPGVWLWASGKLISVLAEGTLGFFVAVVALVGIVASYLAMVWVVGLIAARRHPDERPPRFAWNRSLRGERHEAPPLNALERLFIVAALLAGVAYNIWFFTAAGPPIPLP